MSEEELIKVITYKLNMKNTDVYAPILYEEIQGLLDLYNKEKEKNKELEEKIKEINEEYEAEQKHEMKNTIPKSKIEKLLEEIDNSYNDDSWWYINKIQELLQEGDDKIGI